MRETPDAIELPASADQGGVGDARLLVGLATCGRCFGFGVSRPEEPYADVAVKAGDALLAAVLIAVKCSEREDLSDELRDGLREAASNLVMASMHLDGQLDGYEGSGT